MHSDWRNGALCYWDTHKKRLVDAIGPNVVKYVSHFDCEPMTDSSGYPSRFLWTVTTTGTAVINESSSAGDVNGVLLLQITNPAADNYISGQLRGDAFKLASGKPCYFGIRFLASTATAGDFMAGLFITDTSATGGVNDGVYFRKADADTAASIVLESNTSESTGTTDLVCSTGYQIWEWYFDGTNIDYFVDGVKGTRLANTNLPSTAELTVGVEFTCGSTGNNYIKIDWIRAIQLY